MIASTAQTAPLVPRAANGHRRGGSLQGTWHQAIWEQLAQVLCDPAEIAFERGNIREIEQAAFPTVIARHPASY
ncbi:hypothetical protein [Roseovarius sp.]|uniref:hypothetical protein n=1 Tax=Roseovarius sp. TaxID=1486281 RepID=UPI00356398B9